jgi:hypothetical protein
MFDDTDQTALRTCALLCWENREQLALAPKQIEHVLIAWMAIGAPKEAEAAAEALAALRNAEDKQFKFTQLLNGEKGGNG